MKLDWELIETEQQFQAVFPEIVAQPLLVIDTEFTKEEQYGKAFLIGLCVGYPMGSIFKAYYLPWRHGEFPGNKNLPIQLLQELKRCPIQGTQVYHNWQADHAILCREGIDYSDRYIFDTMIAQHLCEENHLSYGLDHLARIKFKARKGNLTGLEKMLDDLYGKNNGWSYIPPLQMGKYACTDVFLTYLLYRDAVANLQHQGLDDLYDLYEKFIKTLYKVTSRGLHIDETLARKLQDEGRTEMQLLLDKYEFNLGSSQKVAHYLHEILKVPVKYRTPIKITSGKRRGGAPSTSSLHLRRYRDEYPQSRVFTEDVLRYRNLSKAVSTWYEGFLTKRGTDGLLHPGLTIAGGDSGEGGTKTGRLSCREPNLQQVPRATSKSADVRRLFLDPPGYKLIELDYSQAELRITGHYMEAKGDATIADSYRTGTDIHSLTAENMGLTHNLPAKIARQVGKTCNFSLCYRAGAAQLRNILYRDADMDVSLTEATQYHTAWHKTYPLIAQLNAEAESRARKVGYVRMINGRRRHLHASEAGKAFNSVIQGSVGQIMVKAMVEINDAFPELAMVNSVHDSCWFYIKEDEVEEWVPKIIKIMEQIPTQYDVTIPFVVDYKFWSE